MYGQRLKTKRAPDRADAVLQGFALRSFRVSPIFLPLADSRTVQCLASAYPRQREYPQPPPPSRNNTRIMINRVDMYYLASSTSRLGTKAKKVRRQREKGS